MLKYKINPAEVFVWQIKICKFKLKILLNKRDLKNYQETTKSKLIFSNIDKKIFLKKLYILKVL